MVQALFVHNNFPGQFLNLAADLAADPANVVAAIGSQTARDLAGVRLERYSLENAAAAAVHPFARRFDLESRRAERVLYCAARLTDDGFRPDLVVAHPGWGESLPLRALYPQARIVAYCEFFYRAAGLDIGFDREGPQFGVDGLVGLHAKNAASLLALAEADVGLAPTAWQRSTFPPELQGKIKVVHEGIDLDRVKPAPGAMIELPNGAVLSRADEVVTYVARSLEPVRGFRTFMRALPAVLDARPNAQVVIIGGDGVSYGAGTPDGAGWRDHMLAELGASLDASRVHFLGRVPYSVYLATLQLSTVHVYLTYPFVLSWSLLEAMAAECVIVASATPPVEEVLNDRNGILVPFFDPGALSARLTEVLANPRGFVPLGRRARRAIQAGYAKDDCLRRTRQAIGLD